MDSGSKNNELSDTLVIFFGKKRQLFLDEPALVWDAACNQLYLYRPRPDSPKLAFKGGRWMWSGKLKPEFAGLSLEEIYQELVGKM